MSITSRCNGCGATSLDGVLGHMPSCAAAKPSIMQGNIMPSMTITFDNPEDQLRFAKGLTKGVGDTEVTGMATTDAEANMGVPIDYHENNKNSVTTATPSNKELLR